MGPLEPSRQSRQVFTRLGPELDAQVTQIAERQGVTRSRLIREAVKDYLAHLDEDVAAAS